MKDYRHVLWSITINNPEISVQTESWMELSYKDVITSDYMVKHGIAKHVLIGREHWKSGKTPHFQIALCTSDAEKFSYMKGMFPRAHLESVDYPYEVLVNYCKKDMNFIQKGNLSSALRTEKRYRDKLVEDSKRKLDEFVKRYYNENGYPAGAKEAGN